MVFSWVLHSQTKWVCAYCSFFQLLFLPNLWLIDCMCVIAARCGCMRVCWGGWNSIRQMGLFRVLSLLPKKGPICLSLLPTLHINMYSTYPFYLHSSIQLFCFCFSLPFASIGYSHWWKQNAPEPLSQPENELNRGVLQVLRERRKREPSVRGFHCRDYSVQLVSESES